MSIFKKIWTSIDGKKTIAGVLVTGVGAGMFFVPVMAPAAKEVLIFGLSLVTAGITHKVAKAQIQKRNGHSE